MTGPAFSLRVATRLETPPRTVVTAGGHGVRDALRAEIDGAAADVVAVPVGSGAVPGPGAAAVAQAYGVDLATVISRERVGGSAGELVRVPVMAPDELPVRWFLVGVGGGTPADLRRAAAALARGARGRAHLVTTLGDGAGSDGVRALVEGLVLGGYAPPSAGLRNRSDGRPVRRAVLVGDHAPSAVTRGALHAAATARARDLTETPSNIKSPAWMVEQATAVAARSGLAVDSWDAQRLAEEGFGGLLAVGGGSASTPAMVRLDYRPDTIAVGGSDRRGGRGRRPARERPVVLVGKGITYDTGGLSIKPRESMVSMKTDMAGAAAVLAVLAACSAAGVRRPVTGLLPLAENSVGAASYRPGDVVTIHGGRTVEIINTDAEGRLVLADALDYAVGLEPDVVVDIATLTGAASLGLGRRHAALYATDDPLGAALLAAAGSSGEPAWRMPMVEDYRPALDSPVADLRHIPAPSASVGGGSITAALFLREFTAGGRWAHLDVAGPARSDKDEHEVTRGATGYGARLLLRWLERLR